MPVLTSTTRYTSRTDIAAVLGTSASALALLSGETDGFAIDATTAGGSVAVKDVATPANNKSDVALAASNLVQSGTSAKTVTWNDGFLRTFAAGQIAQQYDGSRFGILVEPAATNLQVRSQEFDDASWTTTNATISANIIAAPDQTVTADKLIENASVGQHGVLGFVPSVGVTYGVSVFAKSAGESRYLGLTGGGAAGAIEIPVFNLDTGTVDLGATSTVTKSAEIESIGNGWYRCKAVIAVSNASAFTWALATNPTLNGTSSYSGDGASGLYLWGSQAETASGNIITSYIATTSATVTRNGDKIGCATSTYPHSDATGTFIAWFRNLDSTNLNAKTLVAVHDGTGNERQFFIVDNGTQIKATTTDGGASQSSIVAGTATSAITGNKAAFAYQLNNEGILSDGGAEATDVVCTMPTVTTFNLGHLSTGANQHSGYIYQMTYVPRRMTAVEMQTRTV